MPAYKVIAEFVDLAAGGKRRKPGEVIEVSDAARVQALLRAGVIAAQPVGGAEPEPVEAPAEAEEADGGEEATTRRARGRRGR